MLDIFNIKLKFRRPVNGIPSIDLRPPRNAWPDLVTTVLLGRVPRQIAHGKRSWADKGHVPAKDIPHFGQFVQRRLAKERPKASQSLLIAFTPFPHRPELDHSKRPSTLAGAFLTEKNRTPLDKNREQSRQCRHRNPNRRGENNQQKLNESAHRAKSRRQIVTVRTLCPSTRA